MSERALRATLYGVALAQLTAGLVLWVSPQTLLDLLGDYGGAADHWIRYLAAGLIAPGIGLVVAARRTTWRVPLLSVGAILNAILAVDFLVDIGHAPTTIGAIAGAVSLALVSVGAAYLATVSAGVRRARRGSSSGA